MRNDSAPACRQAPAVDQGQPAPAVAVGGRGAADAVAPNTAPDGEDNPEGRARNRRVEIGFSG
ncbi:hypothetical protein [Planomonospora venezuelensis]|uniref:Outer membrane protein OmpA-like peptidoglycan-associated protein n=1 Tax=Planomonospora venezuelensis TaxID=1999 RepID=A0A841D543_PLAVE|nr:hypothetical protein [Planomonospora venezuelensis]MBB5965361.1 outer membrane protein OmpA-like peptidoglycan-associated protein [Planomonospora venezuelensis]GIN05128.1 hypothetical protein Pve01_67860 [Planomonospora venezuelensis]